MGTTLAGLRIDEDGVKSGRWFSTREQFGSDLELLVASIRTPGFSEAATAALRQNDIEGMESDEALAVLAPVVAEYLLLGWKKLEEDDGRAIPYSREKAVELLCDPLLEHLVRFVIEKAQSLSAFLGRSSEDALGN